MKEGAAVGVNGTPATFINGRKIAGAYPFETFKKIVDEELAKKTARSAATRARSAAAGVGNASTGHRVSIAPC